MKINSIILSLTATSLILVTPSNSLAEQANYFTESNQKQLCSSLKQNSSRCYTKRSSAGNANLKFSSNNKVIFFGIVNTAYGPIRMESYGNYSRNGNVYTVNWYEGCSSNSGCNTRNDSTQYIVTESGSLRAEGGLFISTPCN